jgi:hypothetical protein
MILFRPIQHLYGHLYFHDARGILVTREIIKRKLGELFFNFYVHFIFVFHIFLTYMCYDVIGRIFTYY